MKAQNSRTEAEKHAIISSWTFLFFTLAVLSLIALMIGIPHPADAAIAKYSLVIQAKCESSIGGATFDVYINNKKVADDVSSFKNNYAAKTQYMVSDIKVESGYTLTTTISTVNGSLTKAANVAVTVHKNPIVMFNANGGLGTMPHQSVEYLNATQLANNKFTRPGYAFAGWSIARNGKVCYKDAGNIAAAKDLTLYACWTLETYLVSFDANGGTGVMPKESMFYNTPKTLLPNKFSKTGCTFAGWATFPNGTVEYADTEQCTVQSNIVLYAIWAPNTYQVYFNLNGGNGFIHSKSAFYGSTIELPQPPNRSGYEFLGWTASTNGTGTLFLPKTNVPVKGKTIYYAQWRKIPSLSAALSDENAPITFDVSIDNIKLADNVSLFSQFTSTSSTYSISDIRTGNPHFSASPTAVEGVIGAVDTNVVFQVTQTEHDSSGTPIKINNYDNGLVEYWSTCSICGQPIENLGVVVGPADTPSALNAVVSLSKSAGAYPDENIELEVNCPNAAYIIYTLDGSTPSTTNGFACLPGQTITLKKEDTNRAFIDQLMEHATSGTIQQSELTPTATVVKACPVMPGGTCGAVETRTYFLGYSIKHDLGCIVVSIVTEPTNLFDVEFGILTQENYLQSGREWERPAHIEVFDTSDELTYAGEIGIRVRGGATRIYPQKSFNVYFRKDYGDKNLKYPLFSDNTDYEGNNVAKYKHFSLRNGGNDAPYLKFRDSMIQTIIGRAGYDDVAVQSSRMAAVFLNGEYYGAMSLNEKYSDYFFESKYGIDSDNLVMFDTGKLDEGLEEDIVLYEELLSYEHADLSTPDTWEAFSNLVDIDSMARYYAAEIYIGNADWGEHYNNYRIWRARNFDKSSPYADCRWRWALYDCDIAAGLYDIEDTQPDFNSIQAALDNNPLFANAMNNETFRDEFFYYLDDMANRIMPANTVSEELASWRDRWTAQLVLTSYRFAEPTEDLMEGDANQIAYFFSERPAAMTKFIEEMKAAYQQDTVPDDVEDIENDDFSTMKSI